MSNRAPTAVRGRLFRLLEQRALVVLIVIVLLLVVMAFLNPQFRRAEHFRTLAEQFSPVAVAAIGQTLVILIGGIDISAGANLALSATVAGKMALIAENAGWSVPMGLAGVFGAAILAGALVGAVNGLLTGYGRLPGIVVTLGTMSIIRGGLFVWTQGNWVIPPDWFHSIGLDIPLRLPFLAQDSNLIIPFPFWAMLLTGIAFALFLAHAPAGRQLYATGGNRKASALAGVNIARQTFLAYLTCGALIGLAAALRATQLSSIATNMGQGFELDVIASSVIGGTNIFGGEGGVLGACAGAAFLTTLGKAVFALGIDPHWQKVFTGAAILLAIMLDVWRPRRLRRKAQ